MVLNTHSECSEGILEEVSLMKEDTEMFVSLDMALTLK